MTTTLVPKRTPVRARAGALAAGFLMLWSGAAMAANPPESFSGLAEQVTPAVVNVLTTQETRRPDAAMPDLPFDFPEGSPFERFFRQFEGPRNPHDERSRPPMARGLGSGFIIDPSGYVVTNNHVVDGADSVKIRLVDDSSYPATVVGIDEKTDLALLKVDAQRDLPFVSFGDSDATDVGDWVLAVGNPFGLGGSVTAGIVSARGRNIDSGPYDDFLQIDAPINKGNSGGPLFDMEGRVVGVNTAIFSPNGGSVGIGFAIPANIAEDVIAQLKEHGRVERGWLGVQIQPVTPEMGEAIGLDGARGTMVADVSPDSPADQAGLRQGDVIVAFSGQDVDDARDLARIVADHPAGEQTTVSIWRDGRSASLDVVPGRQPMQNVASAESPDAGAGATHAESLNADLAALTPELRSRFGIEDGIDGVLVTDVEEGSAYDQGLRPGDVIKQVNRTAVASPAQVAEQVDAMASDDRKAVLILVNRQGRDLYLGLRLDIA